MNALKANVCRSYRALSKVINGWCSPKTIEKWLKAYPEYHIYSKNIKSGLTITNRVKQVAFSQHVQNRWVLPAGTKILWLHCDEKWFHALVPRNNAKAYEALGIKRQTYSAHHKSHIGKVMAHCTVGYLFDSDVEEGGQGFLIGAHRCAGFKIPLRDIRYASKYPVSNRTVFKGNAIKHHKGVPHMVNCNVAGSKVGTPTEPTFPLKLLWEHCLMPSVEKLLAPGGPCFGAQVILQEDNAGPHTEYGYPSWLRSEFAIRQWRIELQAPQGQLLLHPIVPYILLLLVSLTSLFGCVGPYTNVLDLSLFPSMSHRHSAQLQLYNNTEATLDRIWQTVEDVWAETSSSEVARAFVLAFRVMRLIIAEQGNNSWLAHGTLHCNVRLDYRDTPTGIVPK